MEEKILKIINNRISTFLSNPESQQRENAAKEITEMMMEFISWLREITPTFRARRHLFTNTELFQYWLTNIKSK